MSEPGFQCTSCRRPFPATGFPYRCPTCGGIYDYTVALPFDPLPFDPQQPRGLARYQRSFPIPAGASFISLGEGGTPLVPVRVGTRTVHFKCEFLNPTGSFKDRGTAVLVSALGAAGVRSVVEDSSGNAGASLAAYAARAGMRARIFVPESASGPKRAQIEAYGAEVVPVPGPRTAASEAVRRQAEADAVYASHAYLPHGLAGVATLAFELSSSSGASRARSCVRSARVGCCSAWRAVSRPWSPPAPPAAPRQSSGCRLGRVPRSGRCSLPAQPGWAGSGKGRRWRKASASCTLCAATPSFPPSSTAVDVCWPSTRKTSCTGADVLARAGLWVEPTSAVVWPALVETLEDLQDPIVAVLTGSGYKRRMEPNP